MDLSGTQGELPMAMHGGGGGGSPYLGLHHGHYEHPQQHSHGGANGRHMSPPPDTAAAAEEDAKTNRQLALVPLAVGGGAGVRYRECLKNHAAAIGGSATDGCGEFMPAGDDGSLDALRCSACGCHRNFHRKDPLGGDGRHLHGGGPHHHPLSPMSPMAAAHHHHHHRGLLVAAAAALPPAAPTRMVMPLSVMHHHHQQQQQAHHHHHHHQSSASAESDEGHAQHGQQVAAAASRKRFRTKFTAEQKARMFGFAEEAGWRLQKLDDAAVQRFCQEVGVKRRVLKVWMHNNKHTLARRGGGGLPGGDQQQGQLGGMPLPEPGEPGRSPSRSRSPPPQQQLRLE